MSDELTLTQMADLAGVNYHRAYRGLEEDRLPHRKGHRNLILIPGPYARAWARAMAFAIEGRRRAEAEHEALRELLASEHRRSA